MAEMVRPLVLSLVLALASDAARAGDAEAVLGGFLCVRPFAPACGDEPGAFPSAQAAAACQNDADQFVAATRAYRECLERQIASAMREANDLLDRVHRRSPAAPTFPARGAGP